MIKQSPKSTGRTDIGSCCYLWAINQLIEVMLTSSTKEETNLEEDPTSKTPSDMVLLGVVVACYMAETFPGQVCTTKKHSIGFH